MRVRFTRTQRRVLQHADRRAERGLSGSVQYAVVLPALMLAVLGTVQAGVWVHGRDVAQQAARLAVDETRGARSDLGVARTDARRLGEAGGLHGVDVRIDRGAERVQVTVSASAPTFFDVGLGRIAQHASAPVERVTRP